MRFKRLLLRLTFAITSITSIHCLIGWKEVNKMVIEAIPKLSFPLVGE